MARFPERRAVPEFTTFASLLRMTAKYGFSNVRETLIEDIKGAYPAKWEDFQAANILGEDIFGSPKPHPNAVLNLFLEQNIRFALPFAAYRTCLGGFSALVSDKPGTVLPRLTLASVIHGRGEMNRTTVLNAYGVLCLADPGVCTDGSCVLHAPVNPAEGRKDAINKIFDAILRGSEVDMLSPLSLGTLVCKNCAKWLESTHVDCRKEFIWAGLPSLLGWESWEGV